MAGESDKTDGPLPLKRRLRNGSLAGLVAMSLFFLLFWLVFDFDADLSLIFSAVFGALVLLIGARFDAAANIYATLLEGCVSILAAIASVIAAIFSAFG